MKLSTTVLSLLALSTSVFAGLEDAKFSIKAGADNLPQIIRSQEVGTLTAFFAPWCGHCKSLEPTWTKVAELFKDDDRCKLAHYDADDAANRGLAQQFGVQGFPTIKFIPSSGAAPIAYEQSRTEGAFLSFLNEQCGTHFLPGGGLNALAGRIEAFDSLAQAYFHPTATRSNLLAKASQLLPKDAATVKKAQALADYYVKVMDKWVEDGEQGLAWVQKEGERLGKILSRKGQLAGRKIDELQMKQNILKVFAAAKGAAADAAEAIEDSFKGKVEL